MGDTPSNGGPLGLIAAVTAVIGLAAAGVGLATDWYGLQDSRRCSVSGRATDNFSGEGVAGVRISYTDQLIGSVIATSGTDGAFSGSCEGASAVGDRVQLFTVRRPPGLPGLPCLHARASGVVVETSGKQEGIDVPVPPQC